MFGLAKERSSTPSEKSAVVTLLLCIFFGSFGIHRFYVGKWFTGILMLITFGGFGIWYLVDIALLVSNRFTDAHCRVIELAKKPINFKTIITVIAVFIAIFYGILIGSIVITFLATGAMVSMVQNQTNALVSGDIKSAYTYMSTDFQNNMSSEKFAHFIKQHNLDTISQVSFQDRRINGNHGLLTGQLTLRNGSILGIQYNLQKEGDHWKIVGIGLMGVPSQENTKPVQEVAPATVKGL
ncbi:MAG: hypothetical protein RLZ35_175 [Pseudomonadota bacterium]|jgi:hypothetical protein